MEDILRYQEKLEECFELLAKLRSQLGEDYNLTEKALGGELREEYLKVIAGEIELLGQIERYLYNNQYRVL